MNCTFYVSSSHLDACKDFFVKGINRFITQEMAREGIETFENIEGHLLFNWPLEWAINYQQDIMNDMVLPTGLYKIDSVAEDVS